MRHIRQFAPTRVARGRGKSSFADRQRRPAGCGECASALAWADSSWEALGGRFNSPRAVASWGADRLDSSSKKRLGRRAAHSALSLLDSRGRTGPFPSRNSSKLVPPSVQKTVFGLGKPCVDGAAFPTTRRGASRVTRPAISQRDRRTER
jgi:hypothetical protein